MLKNSLWHLEYTPAVFIYTLYRDTILKEADAYGKTISLHHFMFLFIWLIITLLSQALPILVFMKLLF